MSGGDWSNIVRDETAGEGLTRDDRGAADKGHNERRGGYCVVGI